MIGKERCEPVRNLVKERISLHLRKTSKVHIATLFLHVDHTVEGVLKFFKLLLFGIRMQNIIQDILLVLFLLVSMLHLLLILKQLGHNFLLDGVAILIGTQTIEELLLQLNQLLHAVGVLYGLLNQCSHLREEEFL